VLNGVRDRVSVRSAKHQRLQNKQVQRALQDFTL